MLIHKFQGEGKWQSLPGAHVRRHAQGNGGSRDRRRDLASGNRRAAWSQLVTHRDQATRGEGCHWRCWRFRCRRRAHSRKERKIKGCQTTLEVFCLVLWLMNFTTTCHVSKWWSYLLVSQAKEIWYARTSVANDELSISSDDLISEVLFMVGCEDLSWHL